MNTSTKELVNVKSKPYKRKLGKGKKKKKVIKTPLHDSNEIPQFKFEVSSSSVSSSMDDEEKKDQ